MDRTEAQAPGGGDASSPARSARQADERERRLAEREHEVAARERAVDEREFKADERERQADERERKADQREREADEREALRQHAAELRARSASAREQAMQAVLEAESMLDANEDGLRRAQAALDRAYASAARERARAARSAKRGELLPVLRQRDVADLVKRVSALRRRTAESAALLAEIEEHAARIHDELAAREPGNPRHKRLAEEARKTVRRAREIERRYTGSQPERGSPTVSGAG